MLDLARTAANAILTELHDKNKATNKYLSSSGSEYSWKHCTEERKLALLGTTATNDIAESTLGGCTSQIQRYGRIGLSNASAISDMKRNGFIRRPTGFKQDNKPRGLFHEFNAVLRDAIVEVAMRDAPECKEQNNKDLKDKAQARRVKEEMTREKNMEKVTDEYIEALYLIRMYDSDACVKGDARGVKRLLKKLKSKTARYNAIKTNITIRVKGFGWEWCRHAWSQDGHEFTVEELAKHLEWIVCKEKKRKLIIPDKETPNIPQRIEIGQVGTSTDELSSLNIYYFEGMDGFEKRARIMQRRREVTGVSSIYSRLQPFDCPEVDSLLGKNIDYLFGFGTANEMDYQLIWCQEEVIKVGANPRKQTL